MIAVVSVKCEELFSFMSSYELWSLIISVFVAVGTCGATILSLYFWSNDRKIKLDFRAMHADSYGAFPNVDGGYFVVVLTNKGYHSLNVEILAMTDQKKYFVNGIKSTSFFILPNSYYDRLPKKIGFGESYISITPMNDVQKAYHSCFSQENNKVSDIKIVASISTAKKDLFFELDKKIQAIINKTILN